LNSFNILTLTMEESKTKKEKSQELNNEEKYISEIFHLLKSDLNLTDKNELFQALFMKKSIDNDDLLNRIKSL